MNKTRISGLRIPIVAIIITFTLVNDSVYLISGLLIGYGIGLFLTGKFGKKQYS